MRFPVRFRSRLLLVWHRLEKTRCHLLLSERSMNEKKCLAIERKEKLRETGEDDAFGTAAQAKLKFELWLMRVFEVVCESQDAFFFSFSFVRCMVWEIRQTHNVARAQPRVNDVSWNSSCCCFGDCWLLSRRSFVALLLMPKSRAWICLTASATKSEQTR